MKTRLNTWCAAVLLVFAAGLGACEDNAEALREKEPVRREVCVTASAAALGLNLGNITDARRTSILLSGEEAARRGIPVILDLVGIGCSGLRRSIVQEFLAMRETCTEDGNRPPLILKGNLSEIRALTGMAQGETVNVSGVDASPQDVVNDGTRDDSENPGPR